MLKVGQNPMVAVKSASEALSENSLVKFEVNLMLDRARLGVSEQQSIGCFAEDVYHPEIELFVQALLLSRRVGGSLADTLERLAVQCRKRQYFRNSAQAAVSMQKGSIWFILGIMVLIETYLYFKNRESVVVALQDPVGWQVWQTGIVLIIFGIWWVRQVTKLKI
jgi:tight adherence protein B